MTEASFPRKRLCTPARSLDLGVGTKRGQRELLVKLDPLASDTGISQGTWILINRLPRVVTRVCDRGPSVVCVEVSELPPPWSEDEYYVEALGKLWASVGVGMHARAKFACLNVAVCPTLSLSASFLVCVCRGDCCTK